MKNLGNLMKQASQMQAKMAEMQARLAALNEELDRHISDWFAEGQRGSL